jgi:hypothetical protein
MIAVRWPWILFVISAAAVAVFVENRQKETAREKQTLTAARLRNDESRSLLDERLQLQAKQPSAEEWQALQRKHRDVEALRARLAELQWQKGDPGGLKAIRVADRGPEEARDWRNAGRASPRAAFESVLWAASRGDVDQLAGLLSFTPEVRVQAEALYAQLPLASQQVFGSPQKVVATLLAGSFPKDATGLMLLGGEQSEQNAILVMQVEHSGGPSKTAGYELQHAPDGWQLMVPSSVMASFQKTLAGNVEESEPSSP